MLMLNFLKELNSWLFFKQKLLLLLSCPKIEPQAVIFLIDLWMINIVAIALIRKRFDVFLSVVCSLIVYGL